MKQKFITLAALAILCGAALFSCSSDDEVTEKKNVMKAGQSYFLSVKASKGDDLAKTRALSFDGSTLNATWAVGEKVYPSDYDSNVRFNGYIAAQSNGVETYLNGNISPSTDLYLPVDLYFIFPRKDWNYTGQVGTLADIAQKYDYATAVVKINEQDESSVSSSFSAEFVNQQAIVRFTLKENDNLINASTLRIFASGLASSVNVTSKDCPPSDNYGSVTITPSSPTSEIWAALRGIENAPLVRLIANVNGTTYIYNKTGSTTFSHNTPYFIPVKMKALTEGIALASVTSDYIGCVVGANGNVYSTKAKAIAAGTTAVAMIAYVSGTGNGLAVALEDESGEMVYSAASTAASGKGTGWRLPSITDWQNMFSGCGDVAGNDSKANCAVFNAMLKSAGGSAMSNRNYWSTSYWYGDFSESDVYFYYENDPEITTYYVRAVLDF